ncbi:hypothetical protein HMPREF1051_1041 [Neisseria sicca VK64]|uniref:Uncharacterized protein n=1 Tax=Neisseria sicca VK64 TaxID=1095748 RepID=I2NV41_NEISI|nr:hypothetical protein HMPREF1051_1041 [Neisseria sicca VK64]
MEIRFSDDLFVSAFHHPPTTDLPFFIGSVWGTRARTWFSDDLRVSLPEGKSVLLCLAVC